MKINPVLTQYNIESINFHSCCFYLNIIKIYSTVTSSVYNLIFTIYILYSSLYQKLVELELTVLSCSDLSTEG